MQDVSLEEETKDDAASRPAALRHANSEMEVGGGKLVGQRADWWRTSALPPAATFLAAALFTVGFIALFTGMGVGAWYVIASRHAERTVSAPLGIAAVVIALGLGLFDAPSWKTAAGRRARTWLSILAALCLVGYVLASVDKFAYGPLCLYLVGLPLLLLALYLALERAAPGGRRDLTDRDGPDAKKAPLLGFEAFCLRAAAPLALVGAAAAIAWLVWVWWGHEWPKMRRKYGQRLSNNGLRCRKYYEENWMDDEDLKQLNPYDQCDEVFLLWISPFIVGVALIVLAVVLRSLGKLEKADSRAAMVILAVAAGLWVTASLAGAGGGISIAIFAAAAAGTLAFAGVGFYLLGVDGVIDSLQDPDGAAATTWDRFGKPYINVWRGLAVVALWPLFLGYLGFTVAQKSVRSCRGTADDSEGLILTKEARKNVEHVKKWNWTPVLRWAAVWGIALVALSVIISKFTVLLMSIIVSAAKDVPLGVATAIIVGTGMFLFLLPPVPGAPIYLAAGVLLTANGKSNGLTVVAAIAYASAVSLVIKLAACVLQQKLIGGNLSGSVPIRQVVGVNSSTIRTTRLVLSEPGFSVAKCALLVGGPDWPTSVLCGILKLPLLPILIGTLPVFFLILPTTIGGAFLVINESYAPVCSVLFVTAAAALQGGSLLVAAYYLDQELTNRKDEIDRIPFDAEVQKADEEAKVRSEALRKNTVWKRVPLAWKAVLILATALMTVSCYLVTIWASRCFRDFAINDTVSKRLKGRWQNIIRPLGVVAVSLFMGSCFLHLLFDCFWYRRQVEDGGDSVPADGGGGPVAAEGEELEPPADGGGNAPPTNEEPRVHTASLAITIPFNTEPESPAPAAAAPAPAAQTTNVERTVYTSGWTAEDRSSSEPHGDYGSWAR